MVPSLDGQLQRLAGPGLALVGIGAAARLDEQYPTSQRLEVELVDQPCGTSHPSSGGGMVTQVLVVEETELKGSVGRLRRVGTTAERGVCLFQAAHGLPGLPQPPQGHGKSEHNLGRLVRSQAVLERGAPPLPVSLAKSF